MEPEILRRVDAATFLGLTPRTLDRYAEQGLVPPGIRLGPGSLGWRRSTLMRWLDDLERAGARGERMSVNR